MQWVNGYPPGIRLDITSVPRFNIHFMKTREAYPHMRIETGSRTATYVYRRPEMWEQYMKLIGRLGLYIRLNMNGRIFSLY